MCCKGVAAHSCPKATTHICVCNCGGACHGSGAVHSFLSIATGQARKKRETIVLPAGVRAMVDILALLGMLPTGRGARRAAKHSRLGLHSGRPSKSRRIRAWAKAAGFHFLMGYWTYQTRLDEPHGQLAHELLDILNRMEDEESTIDDLPPPELSASVLKEIEDILAEIDPNPPEN